MAQAQTQTGTGGGTSLWRRLWAPALIIAMLAVAVFLLPRGYDTHLEKVGNGKYAVVQIFDKGGVQSEQLMDAVNEVRSAYEPRGVEFLVADLGSGAGKRFAQRHGVAGATLLVFGPKGKVIQTLVGRYDEASVRRTIDQALKP